MSVSRVGEEKAQYVRTRGVLTHHDDSCRILMQYPHEPALLAVYRYCDECSRGRGRFSAERHAIVE